MMELITAERRALAGALDGLTDEQWHGPSMCSAWTPAHVLAHLTMPFRITESEYMAGLQQHGGDFTRFSDDAAERDSKIPPPVLVAVLRDNAENTWSPPGGGLPGALSHDVIHGLDIAWPLGLPYEIPDQAMIAVLSMITGPIELGPDDVRADEVRPDASGETLFGVPLDGIRVRATDLDWSVGEGEDLAGHSRDLLMLLAGRRVPGTRFRGAGVASVLAAR